MMREVILDTETTGISPADGHRVVEIGAIELINHLPTGETFHAYLNPERDMPKEAEAVHGLSSAFLRDKPTFAKVVDRFLDFAKDATLVIHNASFDVGFLNAELSYVNREPIDYGRVIDTLQMARRKFPMASNSLDALCRRFGIDNAKRVKHGALLDAELLAEVYLKLIGGRQTALSLDSQSLKKGQVVLTGDSRTPSQRPTPLPQRLSSTELHSHSELIKALGEKALWKKYE